MIDARAVIDPSAKIHDSVTVGPFSVIGAGVEIGAGTVTGPHVVIEGPTRIGENNHIFQFASIGAMPQDKKFLGEDTRLEIGNDNVIREFCTFNRGTTQGGGVTRVGDNNLFMAYVHLAHDCIVGNHTVFSNNASLAGHVTVGDYVILGGFAVVGNKYDTRCEEMRTSLEGVGEKVASATDNIISKHALQRALTKAQVIQNNYVYCDYLCSVALLSY